MARSWRLSASLQSSAADTKTGACAAKKSAMQHRARVRRSAGQHHSMPSAHEFLITHLRYRLPHRWQGTCAPAAPLHCNACACAVTPGSSGARHPRSQASAVRRTPSRRWQAGWLARWGPMRRCAQHSCRVLRWVCSVMRSLQQGRPCWPCARSHTVIATCMLHQDPQPHHHSECWYGRSSRPHGIQNGSSAATPGRLCGRARSDRRRQRTALRVCFRHPVAQALLYCCSCCCIPGSVSGAGKVGRRAWRLSRLSTQCAAAVWRRLGHTGTCL